LTQATRSNCSGASPFGVGPVSTGTGSGARASRVAAPEVTFS